MKTIKVGDKYVIVDNEDYKWLKDFKWSLVGDLNYGRYVAFQSKVNGKKQLFYMHHLVLLIKELRRENGYDVNHINKNTLDNRSKNLEIISHKENCKYRRIKIAT